MQTLCTFKVLVGGCWRGGKEKKKHTHTHTNTQTHTHKTVGHIYLYVHTKNATKKKRGGKGQKIHTHKTRLQGIYTLMYIQESNKKKKEVVRGRRHLHNRLQADTHQGLAVPYTLKWRLLVYVPGIHPHLYTSCKVLRHVPPKGVCVCVWGGGRLLAYPAWVGLFCLYSRSLLPL